MTTKTEEPQISFKERELREMIHTLEQIQDQTEPTSKVRFLRLLAGQAEAYATRIEAEH